MDIGTSLSACAIGALGQFVLPLEVALFRPCAYKIHQLTLKKSVSNNQARLIQTLQYVTRPIDCTIQIIASLTFTQISYFYSMTELLADEKQYAFGIIGLLISPVAVPVILIRGIFHSIIVCFNTMREFVLPLQTCYALYKGKEAAREYFDCRESLIQIELNQEPAVLSEKKVQTVLFNLLGSKQNFEKPKVTFTDLSKKVIHVVGHNPENLDSLFSGFPIIRLALHAIRLLGLFLVEPNIIYPIARELAVI